MCVCVHMCVCVCVCVCVCLLYAHNQLVLVEPPFLFVRLCDPTPLCQTQSVDRSEQDEEVDWAAPSVGDKSTSMLAMMWQSCFMGLL